jgi:hypothetical protein
MGKYTSQVKQKETARIRTVHPIMRGLGCFVMILVPLISYGLAGYAVNFALGRGFPLPPEWIGTPQFHPLMWKLTGLAYILSALQTQTNLYANLVFALGISVVIGGFMAIFFGYLYRIMGPSEFGPTDVPPMRVKVKRYKR